MIFFEDIEIGEKTEFGSVTVDRDEVIDFARRFDPQPFHLSDEAAAQTHFGRLVASGWHTAAMSMRVIVDFFTEQKLASLGSPGVDELRFLKPVYPGDTLTFTGEVLSKRASQSRPEMGSFRTRTEGHNQDGEKVISYQSDVLIARRPAAD